MVSNVVTMNEYLSARGVFEPTVQRYQLKQGVHANRPAITYPSKGQDCTGYRVKYLDGNKPKYMWFDAGNSCTYYSAGGLTQAIKDSGGVVWLLNGEAATWAYHSYMVASGQDAKNAAPVVSWFGEGSVPRTLATDLRSWGATRTFLIPDCDEAGYKAALKVIDALEVGDMPCMALGLPFEFGTGYDFNDLWIECDFDAATMTKALDKTAVLTTDKIRAKLPENTFVIAGIDTPFRENGNGNGHHTSDIDFKVWQREWITNIVARLGTPAKVEGHTLRWHCPMPNHEDKHPSFTVDNKVNPPRPRCTCNIHDNANAWDEIARALSYMTWEEYRQSRLQREPRQATPAKLPTPPAAPDTARLDRVTHEGDKSLDNVLSIIRGDTKSIGNPVVFPLRCLHFAGGFCETIPSGKMVGIVGGSGTGKTALGDTIVDFYNKLGIDTLLSSDEWTPTEVMARRIQRYTGYSGNPHVTLTMWNNHILWLKEGELGIPENQRNGCLLTEWQIKAVEDAANKIKTWHGKVFHIYEQDATQPVLYFEDFLGLVAENLERRRKLNRRADVVVIDYLSLLQLRDVPRGNEIEFISSMLKNHCMRHRYNPFVLSQVTKNASKNAKVNGQALTSDDAQFMRSDKYNLMLAINNEIVENQLTGFSYLNVEKNNLGKTRVKVKLRFDAAHLTFEDKDYDEGNGT